MSVFISWSGAESKSHRIAKLLRDWLPKVIQRLECFLSSKDIDAGAVWFDTLRDNLEHSKIGVLCLTPESILKPWILFEAGFIARSFDQKRVYPLLVGLQTSEIPAPLSIFQAGTLSKSDMLKMVHMINEVADTQALDSTTLEDSFELRWPTFENDVKMILQAKDVQAKPLPKDPDSAAIEEMLKLMRGIASGSIPVTPRSSPHTTAQLGQVIPDDDDEPIHVGDADATLAFKRLLEIVMERRPLIVGFLREASKLTIEGGKLVLYFPIAESFSYESLRRPAQISFLQQCAKEIGVESIAMRLVTLPKQ